MEKLNKPIEFPSIYEKESLSNKLTDHSDQKNENKSEKGDVPEVTKSSNKVKGNTPQTEQSKFSPASQLRTLYNSFDLSDYTKEKLEYEKQLYDEEKKKYVGKKKSFLNTLPLTHPLIIILGGKQEKLRQLWNKKMIPVGGTRYEDWEIIRDFKQLRIEDVSDVLRLGVDGNWDVLCDFTKRKSGLNQYFPEMLGVDTVNGSVIDCLEEKNRNRFLYGYEMKILNNPRIEITKNNFFNQFKQMCRISTSTQPVCNYPTKVGMFIIQEYFHTLSVYNGVPNDHFVVLDPCTGWGSRLLGTLCFSRDLN